MFTIKINELDVDTYLSLRKSVSWLKLKREQAQTALERSLYTVCVYQDEVPVGMGRLVGDGVVICYVQDLVVHPDYQGQGVGKLVLSKLKEYVEGLCIEGTQMMFCLMCAKGREAFYRKFGFMERPTTTLGPGMIQYIGCTNE